MSIFDSAPSSASTTSFPEFDSEVTGPKNRTGLPPWDRTVDVVWHARARGDETRAQRLARRTRAFEAATAHIWSLHRRRPPPPPRSYPSQPDVDTDADADADPAPATGWLALPAAARLQICADLIPDRFSPHIPIRLTRSHLTRDVWLPGSLQELGPILAEVSSSAWARASFCLRADLLAAVLTLFPLHVVGSPFLPAQNRLATRWLPRYLPAVQSLVIELDLTRFGFGPSRGAQRLITACRRTEDDMEEWVGRMLARPDGVDIERLVVLCRRFWGSRPVANKHETPREYCSEQDIFPLVDVLGCLRNRVGALRLAGFPSSLAHRIIAGVFEVPAHAPAVWARHSYRVAPSTAWPRLPGQCSMVDIGQGPDKGWGQLLLDLHEAMKDPAVCHPFVPGYVARRGPYILPPPAVGSGGETRLARLEVLGREAADRNPLPWGGRQSAGPSVKSRRSGVLANGIERGRGAAEGHDYDDDDDDGDNHGDHDDHGDHYRGGGVDFPRQEVPPATPPEKEDHPAPADRRLIRRRKGMINGAAKIRGAGPDSFTPPEKYIEPTTERTPAGGVRRPMLGTRASTSALRTEAPAGRVVGGGRRSEEGGPAVPMLSRWPTFRSRPKTAAEPSPAAGDDQEPPTQPQPQPQTGLASTVRPRPLADHPPRSLLHKISIPGLRHKASAPVLRSKASSPTLGLPRRSVEPLPGSKTQLQHQQIRMLKPESSFSRLRKKLSSTTLRTKASDPSFPPPPPPLSARAVSSPLATNRSSGDGPDRCGGDDGGDVADGRDPSGGQKKMAGKQGSQNELRKKRSGLLLRGKESLAALRKKGSLVSMRAGQFGG